MSEIKEVFIESCLDPISRRTTKIILEQMKNCVCKIHIEGKKGTGFFIKIPYNEKKLRLLITNNHVLDEKDLIIDNVINISLNNEKEFKEIKIDSKRKKYTNEKLDVTIIEIKDEDNINNFLSLDNKIMNADINNYNNIYKNESIYILNYINGKEIYTSYGILRNIEENKIIHKCNTDTGSSGSPIILLKNNKVIGVHYAGSKYNINFNFGTLLKQPLEEYINLYKDNNNKNYIISELDIEGGLIGKRTRIINSFEEQKRNDDIIDLEKREPNIYGNEKEIKDNCRIKINNININFDYFYRFNKKGKYFIEYKFLDNLTKTDYLFYECKSIINLDLSNFNSQKVTNMRGMFSFCDSLKNIDLSNFNTHNVNNMSEMFFGCYSLTNINLSSFNTQNATDMNSMFAFCRSLTNINLSNFYTPNLINMRAMFIGCNSLKNLDLSNFNTHNVNSMKKIFDACHLMKKENLITKDKKILDLLIHY